MPGGDAVTLLDAGAGLWAVVTHVPEAEYGEAAIAGGLQQLDWIGPRALAHEAVVEYFLGARAVLPMQLFTIFASDERAIAHLGRDRRRLDRILSRVERQLEWGLRVTLDDRAGAAAGARGAGRSRGRGRESGTEYLARKRDLARAASGRLTRARADAGRLYRSLARQATSAVRHAATEGAVPGSRVLVDAAFLVPAGRQGAFRAALRREARQLERSGLAVSLTGPWPPYNFVAPGRRSS
jgi:hypothetical protein